MGTFHPVWQLIMDVPDVASLTPFQLQLEHPLMMSITLFSPGRSASNAHLAATSRQLAHTTMMLPTTLAVRPTVPSVSVIAFLSTPLPLPAHCRVQFQLPNAPPVPMAGRLVAVTVD